MFDLPTQRYALLALAAAALFGASTPLAKLLQADIAPGQLARLPNDIFRHFENNGLLG